MSRPARTCSGCGTTAAGRYTELAGRWWCPECEEGKGTLDMWSEYAPPVPLGVETGESDPLGGRSRDTKAAGGLDTLWRRRFAGLDEAHQRREMNRRAAASVRVVRTTDDDDNGEQEEE